ncbi:hypothetical protein AUK04_02430 [Candidatus Roizmanbacteria bacterium CG2_30_33_16]|uniref:Antitoxin n=4 Tax=Candidatus Roizmaniibacteriota TaxID=1752723 RepID=A0A2H0C3T1_9BACT|nr:hypothetical protein [Candidatus Roizmanbacteria bacterium]OIP84402.1 MAG: hypothetical protein AUK04_02430 [Candidatus Roizmanbacteria bacterium CG2_30_33_16]PIP64419.1 MAG: hypothetical protein COW96_02645 [Candidatus Roizmanbacteria bacterium CG22_combo_CG10-13_8_21_14_all_33_16]PIX74571.1 MAG: hypothetical protein COZ39_00205 [Candidatus Roizmanbacteria bacterium CG_4_10_14_3_um_filter_33_21]PJB88151.1 MAG: hypothetical protein CO083_03225 [Candidatus Roizmanbacteria bacterium CG_4_9_14_
MNNIVNISEFRNNISDYINRVIYNKDTFLLKKGKSIVAKVLIYREEKENISKDRIKKFAGILNDVEAKNLKKQMKKFRKNFKLLT